MFTPETSKHFKKYVDESGVVSYILTTRVAPVQQVFYFTNTSMTNDGRYLWFLCTYPPSTTQICAVLDFETDEITVHHETAGPRETLPQVDVDNGDIILGNGRGMYRIHPNDTENFEEIATSAVISRTVVDRFQKNLMGDKPGAGLKPSHLLWDNSKKKVLIDSQITLKGTRVGTIDVETGEYTPWLESEDVRYNHAAICPTNPDIGLLAEDFYVDVATGEYKLIRTLEDGTLCRIILATKDGRAEVIPPMFKTRATHEWWSYDGKAIYSVDMTMGLCRYDLEKKEWELRVPGKAWHGHSTMDEKYYVSDIDLVEQNFRGCESAVRFYNYETKKDVYIITKNPRANTPEKQNPFHMDPHPGFTCNDKYVTHTVTVDGHIDVAITPVDQLIEMTK